MTEYSMQPNNSQEPVALWKAGTEYPVMPKRGPYLKRPKAETPKWRKTFILEWRLYRGMTQEKLAEEADLSTGSIADLEKGVTGYSPESLQAVADALKVTRGKLLDECPPQQTARVAKAR